LIGRDYNTNKFLTSLRAAAIGEAQKTRPKSAPTTARDSAGAMKKRPLNVAAPALGAPSLWFGKMQKEEGETEGAVAPSPTSPHQRTVQGAAPCRPAQER